MTLAFEQPGLEVGWEARSPGLGSSVAVNWLRDRSVLPS